MNYGELVDAVQADLAFDEWIRGLPPCDAALAREAFLAGYQRGYDAGYSQGEADGIAADDEI